MMVKLIDRNM